MNRCAVVTGAAAGIGLAVVQRLAGVYQTVIMIDSDGPALKRAASRLKERLSKAESPCHLISRVIDVADPAQVGTLFAEMDAEHLSCDALVNNAGIFPRMPVASTAVSEWTRVLEVNLTGYFIMAKSALVQMLDSPHRGSIVQIASTQAFRPGPEAAAYAASKGGVVSLTRALASEFASEGVRVNTVVPGLTRTSQSIAHLGDAYESMATGIPLGRGGEPEDSAAAVAFLLSDEASYVTGQAIFVNGGSYMH